VLRHKLRECLHAGLRILRRPPRTLILALVVLAVEGVYVFIVSAGRPTDWPTYLTFLNDQAEGFRAGHLHLSVEPPAALLAAPNPLDPSNRNLWYWDASLYKGHYYLYWGPVPALLLAAVKVLFRIKAEVGDQIPVFALASLQLLAGTLLVERIARRLFEGLPTALVAMGVVAFGFANPTLYNLARGGVYEAAIVGGHAFLLSGLVFAFDAVWEAAEPGAVRPRALLGAGICWALALGCRITIAPAVVLLSLTTAGFATRAGADAWRRRLFALLWVSAPVAITVGALLAYNHARFGAWFEFGRRLQLSWIAFTVSPAFVPANLYSYALRPLIRSCRFPFLFAVEGMGEGAFPRWFHLPSGYFVFEPLAGFLVTVPWSWLWIGAVAAQARAGWHRWRGGRAVHRASGEASIRTLAWTTIALAIAATAILVAELPLLTATMRYLGDAVGGIALGGTLGAWILYQNLGHGPERPVLRRLLVAVFVCLMLATVGIGAALGFGGQYKHFRVHNPRLLDKLEARWSVCRRS
jgi:hypothetical protein